MHLLQQRSMHVRGRIYWDQAPLLQIQHDEDLRVLIIFLIHVKGNKALF